MSANIDAVLARLDEMNNGEIDYEVYRELHDLVSAIEDDVQAPIELFPGTLEALDALSIRARTTSPDAATKAKQPEGWNTEDRREAKCEAERRWSRPVEREVDQQRQSGTINGFILGAEWQKARETFISFRSIADEARAERDAALAAVEVTRKLHHKITRYGNDYYSISAESYEDDPSSYDDLEPFDLCAECYEVERLICEECGGDAPIGHRSSWPCPTVAALDGAPEPEVKP